MKKIFKIILQIFRISAAVICIAAALLFISFQIQDDFWKSFDAEYFAKIIETPHENLANGIEKLQGKACVNKMRELQSYYENAGPYDNLFEGKRKLTIRLCECLMDEGQFEEGSELLSDYLKVKPEDKGIDILNSMLQLALSENLGNKNTIAGDLVKRYPMGEVRIEIEKMFRALQDSNLLLILNQVNVSCQVTDSLTILSEEEVN